jgi:hypothetical protein
MAAPSSAGAIIASGAGGTRACYRLTADEYEARAGAGASAEVTERVVSALTLGNDWFAARCIGGGAAAPPVNRTTANLLP